MVTLFALEDGDIFEWKGRRYRLLSLDNDTATVVELRTGNTQQEKFNPYAKVKKVEG